MVKRYEPKCSCGQGDLMRPINDATEDADQYVEASDYDALDLELSQAYSERQREHELRVRIAGDAEAHIAALEAALMHSNEKISPSIARTMARFFTSWAERLERTQST